MSRTVRQLAASSRDALAPRQRNSHRSLITDRSQVAFDQRVRPLDAIVVPSGRKAHNLKSVAQLAADAEILLVVLASRSCTVSEAAAEIASIPGCRAVIINVPAGYQHPLFTFLSSDDEFKKLSADRDSDLSLKRNIGLALAQLAGWQKIMFLDDDISGINPASLAKVSTQLERHRVTGLVSIRFPDNSVVCHANRLSGAQQGTFITGAALGVNVEIKPLDFFPDVYNEDWLAFASYAEAGEIVTVGNARQDVFNPFEDPRRAAIEEFGDVIAEGLYSLFSDGKGLRQATTPFWGGFLEARARLIRSILAKIEDRTTSNEHVQAVVSLRRAEEQLRDISANACVAFVQAWRADRGVFAKRSLHLPRGLSLREALDHLQLRNWSESEFGLRRGISGLGGEGVPRKAVAGSR